jgi:acetoin utilization deacetylase AcuC-like enzyme
VFETHDTGPGHSERPARLEAVRAAIARAGLASRCRTIEPERATEDDLLRVHPAEYVRRVDEACAAGPGFLDPDTAVAPGSSDVARLAAGSVLALCREVAEGRLATGFAAIRPPGHHAELDRAMGFCLFNNVVVAARYLQAKHGVKRVLIVDWDVHHGNGTQHILEEDPDTFYYSVHQWPLYPGTGARSERGRGRGVGATLNSPLPPGAGNNEFLGVLRDELVPAADRFKPEFVLVSAGFDSHEADPLANLRVTTAAFAEATRIVRGIAERHAGGKLVSLLEGGYDLRALGDSVVTHLETLL